MIDELIALIGTEAFLNLACVFGGGKLYIGATENTVRKLTIVVGEEAAKKMMNVYSGGWINIPKYTSYEIALRNRSIIHDFDAGLSIMQLVQKYELSERQICYILKKPL